MKKLKVLRIIGRLNIGGPAQHVVFLDEGLRSDAFETILIAGRPESSEGDMSYLARERNINLKIVPRLHRELNIFDDLTAGFKIFRIIMKEKPDIIHTHTAKAGALGRFAGVVYNMFSKNKAKLVHTFHGHVLSEYFSPSKTAVFVNIERILARFTDKIIAVSESVRKDLLKRRIGGAKKIIVVPLGLELDRFLKIDMKKNILDKDPLRIGVIGRLVPVKNHKMFIESAKMFITNFPSRAVKFLIVGNGRLREQLENYSKELGLTDFIEFADWQLELEKIYLNLDIVCLTSLNEGTPVSLIEAMASAKCVIATDVGGVRELVADDFSFEGKKGDFDICQRGMLVKTNNVKAFTRGLQTLLDDRTLMNRMGARAREFVEKRYSKQRLTQDVKDLYLSLTRRRRN